MTLINTKDNEDPIEGICFRCGKEIENNGTYSSFQYKGFFENIKSEILCKKCTLRVYNFIVGFKNEFYAKKEKCCRCGVNDGGYAQGECECGMMNK